MKVVVEMLLSNGANVNDMMTDDGSSSLFMASENIGHLKDALESE